MSYQLRAASAERSNPTMGERNKMKTRYRRFPLLSDLHGIKSSIGEMKGIGHPKQPPLNK
ncbi:MAG: hypothetical protein JRD49_12440, partial [Deltaproteobacteria bacterium]|nr:hypothetical protein [Deltaproteobacteria bacterium]